MRQSIIYYLKNKMEQKKELIIRVLEKLKWYRDKAEDLIILLKSSYCTEELIDSIINKVNAAIKTAKKDADKNALRKWIAAIQKIRQREEQEEMSDEELDAEFDKLLNSI